jgi:hypothetical protein
MFLNSNVILTVKTVPEQLQHVRDQLLMLFPLRYLDKKGEVSISKSN